MQGCGPMVFEMLYNAVPKRLTAKAVEGFSDHNKRGYMKNLLTKLWKEEDGQDLTEYALLLVLLTLAAIGSLGTLATAVNGVFANAAANLQTST
jgi:pilus assembly protein Flp/PilA